MAINLDLETIQGSSYSLDDWLTSYPLMVVAIDPYTYESSWILETAERILHHFSPADVRVGFLSTADETGCQQFLGTWCERYLVFQDPDRRAVETLGVDRTPALVFIRSDGSVEVANGWDPTAWRNLTNKVADLTKWSRPMLPHPADPSPYAGSNATA